MSKTETKYPNRVQSYRERIGFTQEQVAHLIGYRRVQNIRRLEQGSTLPGIITALRLSATLRVPVEFLYEGTFRDLRDEVRAAEERMPKGSQGVLPLIL